ncbi:DEAD/DEAH box helicase family protein [Citromicrobium sp. WPS32]|uniref:DEAD/DEAH box helicase family protein n=1 Tax=Citromicrobium sp. WPS32 TaxID=1634517 RepID=UPI0009E84A94|nr:DEAD/DEAH box helicase family protein [Citromicrobium sp. WPS32]MAY77682.1 restriction endonuclease subunit R [Citromicrobium sp.]|tara:strand:- start:166 stop:3699 length:3534 start_codon:yes stop_codon:yes gene_type:complete
MSDSKRPILSPKGTPSREPEQPAPGSSQFAFLAPFPFIHDHVAMAERQALSDPRGSAVHARLAVEALMRWLFDNDAELRWPYQDHLAALIAEPSFVRLAGTMIRTKIDLIRKIGNRSAHPGRFADSQAVSAVRELFHVGIWFATRYSEDPPPADLSFAADRLPRGKEAPQTSAEDAQRLEKQADEAREALEAERKARMADAESRAALEAELAKVQAEITALRKANEGRDAGHDYDEATTRDEFIDALLREAGWSLAEERDIEFPVHGMPNDRSFDGKGKGFVDYVLWGDDGKPLALVEAKRARKDPREGKQQAKLYADCLEERYGQRPVIFYTNGYGHWIWDDKHYPPRPVSGFRTKDELELLIQRRDTRAPFATVPTNRAIAGGAGRTYQEKAIRAVCHRFEDGDHGGENQRTALLVMATGSGKTRVAIALSDVLMRANYAKRVLFLADRTALVRQAAKIFRMHLKDSATVNLVQEPGGDGRVFVSTYPTMMNLIERARQEGRGRFGPGYFDLVIIDEAHRSVYRKYKAIFDWFDAPLLGLTATPKDEIDKNTYGLFELEDGVPTDAYDLADAVRDGFLVPPKAVDVPLKFPREGIQYDDLSDEEKEAWDEAEWGEDGPPDGVDAADVNDWLFNKNTIDQMLKQLMEDGLKVAGGDRLGKTVVFAKNHRHAEYIVERFDANFPALKGHFCQLIDNRVRYAHSLIDKFEEPESDPHIAVSVDMLDTGIDIPDVLNLVFFKIVRSKSKFWQMIGRGTRLREGIFVDADSKRTDKEFFYVFDYLGNLDYFNAQMERTEGKATAPLGERLFAARVDLLGLMQPSAEDTTTVRSPSHGYRGEEPGLYEATRAQLKREVDGMAPDNFIVRAQRRHVEKFQIEKAWEHLSEEDRHELTEFIAGLPTSEIDPDTDAKRFDLLSLRIQLAMLRREPFEKFRKTFVQQVHLLEAKAAVPDVARELELILEVQTREWWMDATPQMVEVARRRLRGLMSLIDPGEQVIVSTDLADQMGEKREVELTDLGGASSLAQFRRKARAFVEAHADHLTLVRLRQGRPLTDVDLEELQKLFVSAGLTSEDDFTRVRTLPDLPNFIRSLVGLDRKAAREAFNAALADTTLSAQQISFVELIVDQLTATGSMDPVLLYAPPFTDTAPNGVSDLFPADSVAKIVSTIEGFEPRSEAG